MTNHLFQLPDGRTLSYSLYGPGDGYPIIYYHGTPSSRLEPSLLNAYNINVEQLLFQSKLQLIAADRPGMGNSTINKKGNFLSFAEDIKKLAEDLQIKECMLLAWSGGGPFALSIAAAYPNLIRSVFIFTGFTLSMGDKEVFSRMHANKLYFRAARKIPDIMKRVMNFFLKRETRRGLPNWLAKLPEADVKLMKNIKHIKAVSDNTAREACKNGSAGAVYEAALYFEPYPFQLNKIQQPVHYWWGSEDNAVIKMHAVAVEQNVPKHAMHYRDNEGHLSIYINYFSEVLNEIAKAVKD